jgi:polar amino acid transport system permease protein
MIFKIDYALTLVPILLQASIVTLEATVGGMALALVVGLAFSLMRRSQFKSVRTLAGMIVEFIRSTPLLIQVFFIFYVLPLHGIRIPTLLCGILALGFHYATYVSEVYRSGIEAVPRGQWEAAHAFSLPNYVVWSRVILPQAVPPTLPALGNYFIAMFKDTPILATIGVHELLGAALREATDSYRYYEPLALVGVIFLALSLVAAAFLRRLEASLARKP